MRFRPTHVVIVDAVEASQPPGFVAILPEDLIPSVAVSTHRLPLTLLISYLRSQGLKAQFIFIGLQVKDVSLGSPMSPEMKDATSRVAKALEGSVSHLAPGSHVQTPATRQ